MEELTLSRVVELPFPTAYDLLRLEASALVVRGDRLTPTLQSAELYQHKNGKWVDIPEWVAPPRTDYAWFKFSLEEANAIRRLTRQPQLVNVWWVLKEPSVDQPTGPYLQSVVAPEGRETQEPDSQVGHVLLKKYGLEMGTAVAEFPTWSLPDLRRSSKGKGT
jgi:hypothetical protein